ncbi:pyridoxal phosphate-dependent aminotransferase [Brooklawnia cerclae]|uniref:cysteine-S-conjugate beta-lyase n=1 Tax=Brooklawnia cerclae TaxID=349934 RepID=A0ABX0SEF3_9ACTN|nr:MalY/PatB family protein [Brooklawnia cerclae]NIH56772.1 cystathionine beta-lyase [Brooklawnia cerclae]
MLPSEFVERYSVERRGTASLKWDGLEARFGDPDLLPVWVADMDFRVPEVVVDALRARVDHGVFGYGIIPGSFYEAYQGWLESRHGLHTEKAWIRCAMGVVPALYWFVNAFTDPGDAVLIQTPVYYPFHNAIRDTGRKLVASDLRYHDGRFTIDFAGFEKAIVDNDVRLFILCSPHNPAGRVWTEDELDRMLGICQEHGVIVVSDEIHHDFTFGDATHVPALSVAGGRYASGTVIVDSASKTFNIASLGLATAVIPDASLRARYDAYTRRQYDPSVLGLVGAEAAYRGGAEWLEALKQVVVANYARVKQGLEEALPGAVVCQLEGTYLPLIDLRAVIPATQTHAFVQNHCKIAVDYGEWFGKSWEGFVRVNLATQPRYIEELIERLGTGYRTWTGERA